MTVWNRTGWALPLSASTNSYPLSLLPLPFYLPSLSPSLSLSIALSVHRSLCPSLSLSIALSLSPHLSLSEVCGKCGEALSRSQPAVRAMNKLFHSDCFCCMSCHRPLQGMQFYDKDGTPQCDDCYTVSTHMYTHSNYMHKQLIVIHSLSHTQRHVPCLLSHPPVCVSLQSSLAVCSRCGERITDRVLKAVGQCFHAHCFRCCTCACSLEGAPFITDDDNNPYCVPDYHRYGLSSPCLSLYLSQVLSCVCGTV